MAATKPCSSSTSVTTSAEPSTTTGSSALSVVIVQRGSAARFRALRDRRPLLNHSAPPCQTPQTGITWGRPSLGRTVATQ